MFGWLRNAFYRALVPNRTQPNAAIASHVDEERGGQRRANRRFDQEAKLKASSSTRGVRARLSPELSEIAAANAIECLSTREPARIPVPGAASRLRVRRLRRFAKRFSAMSPCEARMLVAVHRGCLRAMAADNAGLLHRDIQRFLLSTHGQSAFNGKNPPGVEKIRLWIAEARQMSRARVIAPVR